MKRVLRGTTILLFLAACIPDLGVRDSLITRTQVLAIRAEPPEAVPGTNIHYDLLIGDPAGAITAPASWGYCTTAKLLNENGAASVSCLDNAVADIANGPAAVDAPIPGNACQVFGPDVTTADLRPRDPDITGGYYQPLRVEVANEVAYALERVSCPLPGGSGDIAADFGARYKTNTNPVLNAIVPSTSLDAIPHGARVNFRASWPAESAEPYVVYDPSVRAIVDHRESLRVSWFATGGSFDADRSGRADIEQELFTDNGWTAPANAGPVHMFVVLRDDRGGSTFTTFDVTVR